MKDLHLMAFKPKAAKSDLKFQFSKTLLNITGNAKNTKSLFDRSYLKIPEEMAPPKDNASDPSSALHPSYFQMICEAISSLKERTGSSQQAISKLIEEKYGETLPPNFNKQLSLQLKRFVKSEKLVKVKSSFKTAAAGDAKSPKNNNTGADQNTKKNAARKTTSKAAVKTKPLNGVKTPETLNRKETDPRINKAENGGEGSTTVTKKMKRLSQVKTPEALKKKDPGEGKGKTAKPRKR